METITKKVTEIRFIAPSGIPYDRSNNFSSEKDYYETVEKLDKIFKAKGKTFQTKIEKFFYGYSLIQVLSGKVILENKREGKIYIYFNSFSNKDNSLELKEISFRYMDNSASLSSDYIETKELYPLMEKIENCLGYENQGKLIEKTINKTEKMSVCLIAQLKTCLVYQITKTKKEGIMLIKFGKI